MHKGAGGFASRSGIGNKSMRINRLSCYAVLLALLIVGLPRISSAGLADLADRAFNWWQGRSIDNSVQTDAFAVEANLSMEVPSDNPGDQEETAEEDAPDDGTVRRNAGMCIVPQEPEVTICEMGLGFLCVNTPPGGVAADSVPIKGTIDRRGSVLASIRIAVQNEYTKKTVYVDTQDPEEPDDCWSETPETRPFCLDPSGRFQAIVPLSELGPYTISMSASRLSGGSVEKRVRTSRVVALQLSEEDVGFTPDVRSVSSVDESHVTVTATLLDDCSFCDFIGASTGGIKVSVDNVMQLSDGSVKHITCSTTVEQGGQGQYIIGVPVGGGTNTLTITACNAAVAEGGCPTVGNFSFTSEGKVRHLITHTPDPQPAYDSGDYPTIPWSFSLGDDGSCVSLRFNREAPREVCPDSSGRFHVELDPKLGINVATLSVAGDADDFAWAFGWGRIVSPFGKGDGRIGVPLAAQVALPARTAENIVFPFVNNFLASDEFGHFLSSVLMGFEPVSSDEVDVGPSPVPKCGDTGGFGQMGISLRGQPSIDSIVLEDLSFAENELAISAIIKGMEMGMDLYPDEDGNGQPDRDTLPLTVALRQARMNLVLKVDRDEDGRALGLVTSPHDDCAFKRGSYCRHMPAPLIPKNIVGGANSWGGIVRCEVDLAGSQAREACQAINSLNAQTGVVAEKVLDAINDGIYCGGSGAFTRLMRGGIVLPNIHLGCGDGQDCKGSVGEILPAIDLPLMIGLRDSMDISSKGLLLDIGLQVGDEEIYAATPSAFRVDSAGIITGEKTDSGPLRGANASGYDLKAAVSLDAVNAILFATAAQGDGRNRRGLLDFDMHELFMRELGYDFVRECDEFVPVPGKDKDLPPLCHIRPRVAELLGSAPTSYGYFEAKHPLLLAVRVHRALPPRFQVVTLDDLPAVVRADEDNPVFGGEVQTSTPEGDLLALEVGGLELSFYALEVDESQPLDAYGNPPLKLDEDGNVVIHSMRPDESDPWNGPIIRAELSLLLGLEVRSVDPSYAGQLRLIKIRTLWDRSRLVITAIEGSNATTVPDAALLSSLREKLALAIAGMSSPEGAVTIPLPREIALESDDQGFFRMLGLKQIDFGADGLDLGFDPAHNFAQIAARAVITQLLHYDGEEAEHIIPSH